MATAQATTDHDEIRRWVEKRGGHPARVKDTGSRSDPGVLRIDYPGFSGEDTLEEIGWDEFFEWFDRNGLAMLLEQGKNRFSKIVSRETAASSKKKSSSRRATKSSSAKKASSSKKASTKKASTKKASTKKASTKKASTKKASTKKASAKKSLSTRRPASSKTSSRKKPSAKK